MRYILAFDVGTSGWLCETKHQRIPDYGGSHFTLDETHENTLFSTAVIPRASGWWAAVP